MKISSISLVWHCHPVCMRKWFEKPALAIVHAAIILQPNLIAPAETVHSYKPHFTYNALFMREKKQFSVLLMGFGKSIPTSNGP